MNLHTDITTIISVCSTCLATIGGLWLNIIKNHREYKDQQEEYRSRQCDVISKLGTVIESLEVVKSDLDKQSSIVNNTTQIVNAHMRLQLYNALSKGLTRGNTTVSEAIEVTKLFNIYKSNGGNGEIASLFSRFEKLPIEDDKFN